MSNVLRDFVAVAASVLLTNCDDTCPVGFLHTNHVCILEYSGTGGASAASEADSGADAGTQQKSCVDSTFGNVCMTADDCGCDTAFCAGIPGQQGICSHTGCLDDPAVCPPNWQCQDFSAFQSGLNLCTPP